MSLVHRDIKPANIMLDTPKEGAADGELHEVGKPHPLPRTLRAQLPVQLSSRSWGSHLLYAVGQSPVCAW
jgi:hypothetical protein